MSTWRSKQYQREFPSGLGFSTDGASLVDNRPLYGSHAAPINEYQALMEADAFQEPAKHEGELEEEWIALQKLIDSAGLSDVERLVVDCVVFGQMTLAETGKYLARHHGRNRAYARQTVHGIRISAFNKLRPILGERYGIELDDDTQEVSE